MAASIVLPYRYNALLFAFLLVEAAIALRLWNGPSDHSSFWVIAVLGTVAEIVFVYSGVWRYANPSVLGIPCGFPCPLAWQDSLVSERQ